MAVLRKPEFIFKQDDINQFIKKIEAAKLTRPEQALLAALLDAAWSRIQQAQEAAGQTPTQSTEKASATATWTPIQVASATDSVDEVASVSSYDGSLECHIERTFLPGARSECGFTEIRIPPKPPEPEPPEPPEPPKPPPPPPPPEESPLR